MICLVSIEIFRPTMLIVKAQGEPTVLYSMHMSLMISTLYVRFYNNVTLIYIIKYDKVQCTANVKVALV